MVTLLTVAACENRGDTSPAAGEHLRTESTVLYYLNKEANTLTEQAVRSTFDRWDKATHFDFIYEGRRRAGLRKDGKNTVSFLTAWPKKVPAGLVGYCMNWYDRKGNIIESDIIFNMSLAKFTTLETHTPDCYYIEGVLAHEIGHMLGLGHIDSVESLMKPLSPPEESYFYGCIDEETLKAYRDLYPETGR